MTQDTPFDPPPDYRDTPTIISRGNDPLTYGALAALAMAETLTTPIGSRVRTRIIRPHKPEHPKTKRIRKAQRAARMARRRGEGR